MFQIEIFANGEWVAMDEADDGVTALAKAEEFAQSGAVSRVTRWGETWI